MRLCKFINSHNWLIEEKTIENKRHDDDKESEYGRVNEVVKYNLY